MNALCGMIQIKFFVKQTDVDGWCIADAGTLQVEKWDAYTLFCKMSEQMEGWDDCGVSKKEFNEMYEVQKMGDVMVMMDTDGTEELVFVK